MKLAQLRAGNWQRVGRLEGDHVVVVEAFDSMYDLIAAGPRGLDAALAADGPSRPLDLAELATPLLPRRNLLCCGWNYEDHFDERPDQSARRPDRPTLFTKATTTVAGSWTHVPAHLALTRSLDYEAELAVVVGATARDVAPDDALELVFGYTAANDVTARDLQAAHGGQWFKGKSLDGTCLLGPWLVTADDISDPAALTVRCRLNGVVVQHAATSTMRFDVARLISELAAGMTLHPGDIILTGTPSGIGAARNPPRFLRPGDTLETAVDRVGSFCSTVQ